MATQEQKLTLVQKEKLRQQYEEDMRDVDQGDVEYAIGNSGEKAEDLMKSGIEWIVQFAKKCGLLLDMLIAWWNDEYEFPRSTVAAITVALLYFINPFDMIPDIIPVLGYADDLVVVNLCLNYIEDDLREYAHRTKLKLEEYGL